MNQFSVKVKTICWVIVSLLVSASVQAQTDVIKEMKADINRAAGMFYTRPVGKMPKDTPPPAGKKPFYINHYGCPGAYYLDKSEYYTETYAIFAKADSLGKLTKLGQDVFRRIRLLCEDAKDRYGELTAKGAQQSRAYVKQLVERFPDMFTAKGYYSVRSVVENRCILTMQEGLLQLSAMQQPLTARSRVSFQEKPFMDPEDKLLISQRLDSLTMARFDRFKMLNSDDGRLMNALFNDQNYVITNIDANDLGRQLYILAGDVQHTDISGVVTLYDIFTPQELHRQWRLDGYGLHTENLDSLEAYGWANYRIAPLGGSIEMIHYRSERGDPDVLVKVLLNGHEARLPIESDCAPYYHWNDVKRYYLRKLYRYESRRFNFNARKR